MKERGWVVSDQVDHVNRMSTRRSEDVTDLLFATLRTDLFTQHPLDTHTHTFTLILIHTTNSFLEHPLFHSLSPIITSLTTISYIDSLARYARDVQRK